MARNKLLGVHPDLQQKVQQIQIAMQALGLEMRVTDGFRTAEEQWQLYRQGREIPGPNASPQRPLGWTVTKADGRPKSEGGRGLSNHQAKADGAGHAVDMTFWVDGAPSWAEDLPWTLYGEMAKALGLRWGGDWPSKDRPHIELP